MEFKKPFYSIKIESSYCGYIVCINGCNIEDHREASPLSIEYPVNHWLRNGQNTIDVNFINIPDPSTEILGLANNAEFKCTLYIKEHGQDKKYPLSSIIFSGEEIPRPEGTEDYTLLNTIDEVCKGSTKAGTYEINELGLKNNNTGTFTVGEITFEEGITGALCLKQSVELFAPFPVWSFFNADHFSHHTTLSDDDWNEARKEMLIEYKKIWDAVKFNRPEYLQPILESRSSEYDYAFYRQPGETFQSLLASLERNLSDPEWPLRELSLKTVDYSVSFGGQLVWLHGFGNSMGGAIQLEHTKSDLAKKYMFYYAKIDGEWKVVR